MLKREFPKNLEILPLYILGIFKHRISCKDEYGLKLDFDFSNYLRNTILKLNVIEITSFIYPKLYELDQLLLDLTLGQYYVNGEVNLPNVKT